MLGREDISKFVLVVALLICFRVVRTLCVKQHCIHWIYYFQKQKWSKFIAETNCLAERYKRKVVWKACYNCCQPLPRETIGGMEQPFRDTDCTRSHMLYGCIFCHSFSFQAYLDMINKNIFVFLFSSLFKIWKINCLVKVYTIISIKVFVLQTCFTWKGSQKIFGCHIGFNNNLKKSSRFISDVLPYNAA